MSDVELCPEHVWDLASVITGFDGRLGQRYVCARCATVLDVEPGDIPPGSPDSPV